MEEFILIFFKLRTDFLQRINKNSPDRNFLFSLHILPNVRTNSLFHTVKYKNHSVGYIFHSVGYKSRTVKQRILKGKIKYAAGHPDFIAGAAGNIRRTRQKKS